jgi:hypothetical protein
MFKRLIEIFTGKSNAKPQIRPARPDDPNPQHYTFAHRVLPFLFFNDPELFMTIMSSPKGMDFLRVQWNTLAKQFPTATPSDSLNYQMRGLDDGTKIIIITMPPPQKVTETYFNAVVYRPASDAAPLVSRYFTLEYGMSFMPDAPKRMVLGEWTNQQEHINYGDNPAVDEIAFLKVVCEKLGYEAGYSAHAISTLGKN